MSGRQSGIFSVSRCSARSWALPSVEYFRASGQTLTTYSTILSTAQFPPYERVIPRDSARSTSVEVAALTAAVKRLSLAASEKTMGAALNFAFNKLTLRTDNPDVGTAEEDIDFASEDTFGIYSHKIKPAIAALLQQVLVGHYLHRHFGKIYLCTAPALCFFGFQAAKQRMVAFIGQVVAALMQRSCAGFQLYSRFYQVHPWVMAMQRL